MVKDSGIVVRTVFCIHQLVRLKTFMCAAKWGKAFVLKVYLNKSCMGVCTFIEQ